MIVSARKPASFWREKRDTVVILVRGFPKMLSCQNKSRTRLQVWDFSISKKALLPEIRITEQPIQLTLGKINRPGYKFSKCFRKNGQSNLVLVLVLVGESKGPLFYWRSCTKVDTLSSAAVFAFFLLALGSVGTTLTLWVASPL